MSSERQLWQLESSKEQAMISTHYVPTDFQLKFPGRVAYVLIRSEGQATGQLSQMEPSGEGEWTVSLRLKPGEYLYRFYVNDGTVTVLVPGRDGKITGGAMGWDAVVRVPRADRDRLLVHSKKERSSGACDHPYESHLASEQNRESAMIAGGVR
jgi:hypothetical protein